MLFRRDAQGGDPPHPPRPVRQPRRQGGRSGQPGDSPLLLRRFRDGCAPPRQAAARRTARLLHGFGPSRPYPHDSDGGAVRHLPVAGLLSVPLQAGLSRGRVGRHLCQKAAQSARHDAQLRMGLRPDPDGGVDRRRGRGREDRLPLFLVRAEGGRGHHGPAVRREVRRLFPHPLQLRRYVPQQRKHVDPGAFGSQIQPGTFRRTGPSGRELLRGGGRTGRQDLRRVPRRSRHRAVHPRYQTGRHRIQARGLPEICQLRGFEARSAGDASRRNDPLVGPQPGGARNRQPHDRLLYLQALRLPARRPRRQAAPHPHVARRADAGLRAHDQLGAQQHRPAAPHGARGRRLGREDRR